MGREKRLARVRKACPKNSASEALQSKIRETFSQGKRSSRPRPSGLHPALLHDRQGQAKVGFSSLFKSRAHLSSPKSGELKEESALGTPPTCSRLMLSLTRFKVLGSTGNVYTVVITQWVPFSV